MGCLWHIIRETISFIISIVAFICLIVGGYTLYQKICTDYIFPSDAIVRQRADNFINTDKLPKRFELKNYLSVMGTHALIANDTKNNQKIAVIQAGKLINITKDNIHSDKIDNILKKIAGNLSYLPLEVSRIKVTKKGFIKSSGVYLPYIKVNAQIIHKSKGVNVEGIIGALNHNKDKDKNLLLFSFNNTSKYNHKTTEKFLKYIKNK